MAIHKVNRYSKKLRKKGASIFGLSKIGSKPVRDTQTGFIHHPSGFPIDCKRIWFTDKHETPESETANIGVIFESEKYIKPGSTIEIMIQVRGGPEKFRGKVVLVRNLRESYEIGLWLSQREDASRVRIIEQICHIESYIREKKYREGPYSLNRDKVAQEWIVKNASNVPRL